MTKFLKAGFIDPNTNKLICPEIGTPQGGILSPLLCNIVLHELDKFMDSYALKFRKGNKRKINPAYKKLAYLRSKSHSPQERLELLKNMRLVNRTLKSDPDFRRLEYIRYADDFIILVTGPLKEAEFIRNNVKDFLRSNCGLELNPDKTVITNLTGKR